MKTTIELPDSLLSQAKVQARARRTTLRRLIEEGLREVLARNQRVAKPFRLRDASRDLGGRRMEADWRQVRRVIYEGRGE